MVHSRVFCTSGLSSLACHPAMFGPSAMSFRLGPDVIVYTAAPHLAPGEYGDVLRRLKVVITKDSNVVCVAEAICCVGALAKVRFWDLTSAAVACLRSVVLYEFGHAKCVVMLHQSIVVVQGLRKDFYSSAKSFAPVLLDKFKDKNTGVCRATTDALVNMHK